MAAVVTVVVIVAAIGQARWKEGCVVVVVCIATRCCSVKAKVDIATVTTQRRMLMMTGGDKAEEEEEQEQEQEPEC